MGVTLVLEQLFLLGASGCAVYVVLPLMLYQVKTWLTLNPKTSPSPAASSLCSKEPFASVPNGSAALATELSIAGVPCLHLSPSELKIPRVTVEVRVKGRGHTGQFLAA